MNNSQSVKNIAEVGTSSNEGDCGLVGDENTHETKEEPNSEVNLGVTVDAERLSFSTEAEENNSEVFAYRAPVDERETSGDSSDALELGEKESNSIEEYEEKKQGRSSRLLVEVNHDSEEKTCSVVFHSYVNTKCTFKGN